MLSLTLGPLALPLPPLLLGAGLAAALLVLRLLAPREARELLAGRLWLALAIGLLAARALHLLRHADAYAASPWALLDIRDGGWQPVGGIVAGLALLMLQAPAQRAWRRALLGAAFAGLATWLIADGLALGRSAGDERLPALALTPLPAAQSSAHAPADARAKAQMLPSLLDGRPVVINLWASWCGPCRAEMPMLVAAQQRERGVRFLFVNQGETPAAVQAWLARERLPLQDVWLDPASALGPALGSRALPTTLFVDAQGKRVAAHVGALNEAALRVRLQALHPRPARDVRTDGNRS